MAKIFWKKVIQDKHSILSAILLICCMFSLNLKLTFNLYIIIIISTIITFLFLKNIKVKLTKLLLIFTYIVLFIVQIYTTRIKTNIEFSNYDIFLNQQRLDAYPRLLYRFGNIIENKIESPQIIRFRSNFFNCFDFVNFYKNTYHVIFYIPYIIGLLKLIKSPNKVFCNLLITSLIILTFIGTEGKFGPIILIPFIINIISFYSIEK